MRLKRVTIGLVVVSVMAICLSLVSGAPPNQTERTIEENGRSDSKTSILSAIIK